jgi:hypothetical protein
MCDTSLCDLCEKETHDCLLSANVKCSSLITDDTKFLCPECRGITREAALAEDGCTDCNPDYYATDEHQRQRTASLAEFSARCAAAGVMWPVQKLAAQ